MQNAPPSPTSPVPPQQKRTRFTLAGLPIAPRDDAAALVAVADDASGPPPRRRSGRAAGLPAVPPPAGEVPTRPPSPGVDPMRSTLP